MCKDYRQILPVVAFSMVNFDKKKFHFTSHIVTYLLRWSDMKVVFRSERSGSVEKV